MSVEKKNFCECGCGELVTNRFARGHCHRVVEKVPTPCKCGCGELVIGSYIKGHYDRVRKYPDVQPRLCACGCGEYAPVTQGKAKKFIAGHHHRCRSEETRKKFSEVRKGKKPSEETIEKLKEARKLRVGEKAPNWGKKHSEETKKKYSEMRKGKPNSCGPKISERNKELWQDPEMRDKWIASKQGERHPMFGKQHTEESRIKMSISRGGDGEIDLEKQIKGLQFYKNWRDEILNKYNREC